MLVETLAGAISIGTELPHYLGTSRGLGPHYPAMTGYENVALVRSCGAGVTDFAPGDRIVATYGHRTHALVDARKAIPVPDGISDDIAILSILSCDVAKGVRKLMPRPHDRVLVTGGGTIGLLTVWTLRQYGVEVVDLVEPRSETARTGADARGERGVRKHRPESDRVRLCVRVRMLQPRRRLRAVAALGAR